MARLRVLTYNILRGGDGREDAIGAVLAAAQADVVLLQEVAAEAVVTRLASALGYEAVVAEANQPMHKIALLSRLPVMHHVAVHPFPLRRTLLEARLAPPAGGVLHLFGVHLVAPSHLGLFEQWRLAELAFIRKRMAAAGDAPCLLAGDFNAVEPGAPLDTRGMPGWLRAGLRLQGGRAATGAIASMRMAGWHDLYRELNPGVDGFTLPATRPNTRLDYLFANGALRIYARTCTVLTAPDVVRAASDHLPVAAEFDMAVE